MRELLKTYSETLVHYFLKTYMPYTAGANIVGIALAMICRFQRKEKMVTQNKNEKIIYLIVITK